MTDTQAESSDGVLKDTGLGPPRAEKTKQAGKVETETVGQCR